MSSKSKGTPMFSPSTAIEKAHGVPWQARHCMTGMRYARAPGLVPNPRYRVIDGKLRRVA